MSFVFWLWRIWAFSHPKYLWLKEQFYLNNTLHWVIKMVCENHWTEWPLSSTFPPCVFYYYYYYENKNTITAPHPVSSEGVGLFSQLSVLPGLLPSCLTDSRTHVSTDPLHSPFPVPHPCMNKGQHLTWRIISHFLVKISVMGGVRCFTPSLNSEALCVDPSLV